MDGSSSSVSNHFRVKLTAEPISEELCSPVVLARLVQSPYDANNIRIVAAWRTTAISDAAAVSEGSHA